MCILFMGTGEICLPSLDWLLSTPKHQVVAVVTQPDKPVGRKLVLTPPEVKVRAQEAGIPVHQPKRLKRKLEDLRRYDADIAVVIAYGQILTQEMLDLPRLGCINVHASLLPKYRGAAPIQAAVLAGDAESGVTIMHIAQALDAGDIITTEHTPILPTDTGGSLHDRLAVIAPPALERALDDLAIGTATRTPQDHTLATHVGKLSREDGAIDWSQSAEQIERQIRAYNPWPGTYTQLPGSIAVLKIHAAQLVPGATACPAPGTIVAADPKQGLLVATGTDLLEITELQAPNGRRMAAKQYLRGHDASLPVGDLLHR